MRKHCILVFLAVIIPFFASAQDLTREEIKNSGEYYYGKGTGHSKNEAKKQSISRISQMISVNVSSKFTKRVKEKNKKIDSQVKQVIKTHSMATLRNVQSKTKMLPGGRFEVFSYIKKSEVSEIFDERKNMIASMYQKARNNEQKGNLKFALKYNYFGLLLLKSIPSLNVSYNDINLTQELPTAINRILTGINFQVVSDRALSDKKRRLVVEVTYQNEPVSLLDLSFWAGSENRASSTVREGKAIFDLFGASTSFDDLKIFIEYMNYNARKEFKPVESLWPLLNKPTFDNKRKLSLKDISTQKTKLAQAAGKNLTLNYDKADTIPGNRIISRTQTFIDVLKAGALKGHFSSDSFLQKKLRNYMEYNRPEPTRLKYEADINPTINGYEVRRIPVIHHYPTINDNATKQTTEYCVIDFDKKGNLNDFNLCITESLYEKFHEQGNFAGDWQQRQEIVKFVEKYRTAFLTRDLSTINKMFAEDALIIVGRKIKRKPEKTDQVQYNKLPNQPTYEKIRLTKKQYLSRQKRVFNKQKDISLDFSTFEIHSKSNAENVYGVEMRQNYSSTTYADEGYLFLMIDFNEANPTIYIRAWQPNEWDSASLINTSNFRVYK